jgi:hypothetical protein
MIKSFLGAIVDLGSSRSTAATRPPSVTPRIPVKLPYRTSYKEEA